MFNPMQLMQMMRSGVNPQQLINQAMQQNPQMRQVLQNVNLNDPNSMQQLCQNLCVQKGLDYQTMLAQFRQNGGKF